MARLASIEKMGYYPLPPVAQQRLAHLLTAGVPSGPGAHLRFYDPCAGQGEALRYFADELQHFDTDAAHPLRITTYGVEISAPRAKKAAQVLHHVIQADYENVRCPNEAFSFLYCNPPYDLEGANEEHLRRNRLEYLFLRNSLSRLLYGGLLIYIVPQPILARDNVAKFLSAHLDRITVYRFPKGEFEMFDQIALLAYRKPQAPPNPSEIERIIAIGKSIAKVPPIPSPSLPMPAHLTWNLPAATLPDDKLIFQRSQLNDDDILALYQNQNAFQTDAWRTFVSPPPPTHFTPLTPLRPRHIAALISSGQVGTVTLPDPKRPGRNLLAKGITVKVVHSTEDPDKEGRSGKRSVVAEVEEYQTTIYTLNQHGDHQTLHTPTELNEFLKQHGDPLAQLLDTRYTPLYRAPTQAEWLHVSQLVPYKRLPGRDEAGLLDAQKHTAIATSHSAKRYGWADLIGEMGVGKTCLSLAATDLLHAYPAWVMAPTHTLANWQQEIADTIPGAQGHIIRNLKDLNRFQRNYRPGQKAFAIFSHEAAKLGPGWRIATVLRPKRIYTTDEAGHTTSRIAKFHCCPRCGHPAWQEPDNLSSAEVAGANAVSRRTRQFCRGVPSGPRRRWQGDPAGNNHKGGWKTTELVDIVHPADNAKTLEQQNLTCNEPLFVFEGIRRWPLASYIHDHLPHFFQGGIADEYHKCSGQSTDIALAYHHLVDSTRYLINLTGTLFNGYASSLFWLRYRLDKNVRRDFDFHSHQKWSQLYGRLERMVADEAVWAEDGAFSGTHRYVLNTRELPGISPLIYRRILETTVFLSIENLGYQLPPYEETTVFLDMTPAQQADYDRLNDTLMDTIQAGRGQFADPYERECAQALLGVWLQNTLGRPNSGFRQEAIHWRPPGEVNHVPFMVEAPHPASPPSKDREQWSLEDQAIYLLTHQPPAAQPALHPEDDLSLPQSEIDSEFVGQDQTCTGTIESFVNYPDQPLSHSLTKKLSTVGDNSMLQPFVLPPVVTGNELLPKEDWLLDFATAEIQQHRKILLFVRQTGKRNIQPRLLDVLARANLRARVLPDSVQPIKREAWIKSHMPLLDLLSVNARRVETGLNLVQFCTIVFYEIEYSLYTLMQAMRRVWRLGQVHPVKVLFPIYRGTLEADAFSLAADKMAATRLLYGDNATGAFAGGTNDLGGSILQDLAGRITRGQLIQSNGIASLLTVNQNQTNEWAGVPSGPATPVIQRSAIQQLQNGNGHSQPTDTLFDEVFTSLFAAVTNPKEKRQRDAGQIGLFA